MFRTFQNLGETIQCSAWVYILNGFGGRSRKTLDNREWIFETNFHGKLDKKQKIGSKFDSSADETRAFVVIERF